MTDQNQHIPDDQLQAYLDGALESTSLEDFKAHLAGCPTCREELSNLEALQIRLGKLPEFALSKDISGLVVSQLKEEQSLSPAITWTLAIEALAAGVVLSMLIPVFQVAGWLPRLFEVRLELSAALNIFLTQLASNWFVWWAGLKLQINQLMTSYNPLNGVVQGAFSPWILIGAAGGLVILINALLLGRQPLVGINHNGSQI